MIDILFIENVGNLVCPAGFDLGQHDNVTLLAVTEGDDKPAKYPVMFRAADLVLLSKSDLLDVLDDFAPEKAESSYPQAGQCRPCRAALGAPARNAGALVRLAGTAPRRSPRACASCRVRAMAAVDAKQWLARIRDLPLEGPRARDECLRRP